jgi:hypothetical protein
MTDKQWRWFKHPVTLAVVRVRADDEGYIKLLGKYTWDEIDEPEDWVQP